MAMVNFSITGEYLTQHVRELVLDDWQHAVRTMVAAFPDMPVSTMEDILKGKKKLTGVDTLRLEDDDDKAHQEQMQYLYGHVACHYGVFYEPYAIVSQLGSVVAPQDKRDDLYRQRALRFADSDSDIAHIELSRPYIIGRMGSVNDVDHSYTGRAFLFRRCGAPPYFMPPLRSLSEVASAAEKAGHIVSNYSWRYDADDYDDMPEDDDSPAEDLEQIDEELSTLSRYKITTGEEWRAEKAQLFADIAIETEKNGGYMGIFADGKWLRVPYIPFVRWCLWDSQLLVDKFPWSNVCYSGLKMYGDNPNHSDAVIGAGLDTHDAYDRDEDSFGRVQWDVRWNICETFEHKGMEVLDVRD